MANKELEVILARQFSSYLAIPIFLVDPQGNLIYYNEAAEQILGRRFEETGEMSVEEWSTLFIPTTEEGASLSAEALPLVVALQEHRHAHMNFWIRGLDGVRREIEVVAFPLIGQGHRYVGAMAIFGEVEEHP